MECYFFLYYEEEFSMTHKHYSCNKYLKYVNDEFD